eukprot:gene14279-15766_t
MADENNEAECEEERQARLYRRNTKRLRRNLLEKFLLAMKEDLAEWLTSLTHDELNPINFMNKLDNGVLLCEHANLVQKYAEEYALKANSEEVKVPTKDVFYRERGAFKGSFIARDNVANFISWCRDLGIPDVVMFETEDLVLHKNEKTVILTLLDVARKAAKFGVKPPQIVEFEEEIDREIEQDKKKFANNLNEKILQLEKENDLDQLVHDVVDTCTCPSQFRVKKLGEGKYKFGNCKTLIYVRVMRNHVMVRVGGGWDTLEHYIEKHDPCRLHVAGKIDRKGKGDRFPNRKQSKIMEHSDEASVCSSESFGSADGCPLSSISPDSEDFSSPQLPGSRCSSHRSSMQQDSDDDTVSLLSIKSEPIRATRRSDVIDDEQGSAVRNSKSEAFTMFGSRKLSLMDETIKDTDVYATNNPSDKWLRKQLNEVKLSAQTAKQVSGKSEQDNELGAKDTVSIDDIRRKYGKEVKCSKTPRRDDKSAVDTRVRRRTKTTPETMTMTNQMPDPKQKTEPQYSSWDQTDVAAKRRKDIAVTGNVDSGQESGNRAQRRKSSTGIPVLIPIVRNNKTQRPDFHKAYTLDNFKSTGIRRRGSDARAIMNIERETSLDSIVRKTGSRLPIPTTPTASRRTLSTGKLSDSASSRGQKENRSASMKAATRNPTSRLPPRKPGDKKNSAVKRN